ncbi:hypothetical protein QYF61_003190 [Mycteria americana]|uniref:Uncharacterized protein n=1 Tax=Mycteria americana TaxID=33587 RepID=A0AAN7NRQ5_MYCAM|nr:hypothetical protein QYF61_003190 [Mycteria americana]
MSHKWGYFWFQNEVGKEDGFRIDDDDDDDDDEDDDDDYHYYYYFIATVSTAATKEKTADATEHLREQQEFTGSGSSATGTDVQALEGLDAQWSGDSELVSDSLELLLLDPLLESPEARALDCGTPRLPAPHSPAGSGEGRKENKNIKKPHESSSHMRSKGQGKGRKSVASRWREVILPLYSVLVWAPQYKRDMEQLQQGAMKKTNGLE